MKAVSPSGGSGHISLKSHFPATIPATTEASALVAAVLPALQIVLIPVIVLMISLIELISLTVIDLMNITFISLLRLLRGSGLRKGGIRS